MKKFLLLAAMAALALGASADGYKLEKVWEITDVSFMETPNVRQGFGMNGKFYINEKTAPQVLVIGQNGVEGTLQGSANTAITRDEAGNIVVLNNTGFAAHTNEQPWALGASILVIDPATNESKDYQIPPDALPSGRMDFLGTAKGDLFENGQIFFLGSLDDKQFSIVTITGGEVDTDECYRVANDLVAAVTTSTVLNYYTDVNGDEAILYVTRNATIAKIPLDDMTGGATLTLPNRGPSNGAFPFVFDGKELFAYTYKGLGDQNYLDGIAIAEAGADEPLLFVPSTIAAPINSFQCNWVNAEVDADGVNIYHYYPGGYVEVYRLTKDEPVPEYPKVYILGEVNEQGWAANAGTEMTFDPENNVYTATVALDGRGESGENYFSFTTELANDNDEGGWAYIAPYRFGAVSEGDFWYSDQLAGWPLSLTYENGQAFRLMGGIYKLTLDKENMILKIEKVGVEPLKGDVNGDGQVNITDVTVLINAVMSEDYNGIFLRNADVDDSGNHNITDVTLLITSVMGN